MQGIKNFYSHLAGGKVERRDRNIMKIMIEFSPGFRRAGGEVMWLSFPFIIMHIEPAMYVFICMFLWYPRLKSSVRGE